MRFHFGAELRYLGQQSEVKIALEEDPRTARSAEAIRAAFEAEYVAQYGLTLAGMPIELVNWIVTASGPIPDRGTAAGPGAGEMPAAKTRPVYLRGAPVDVDVYQRTALPVGRAFEGPLIVEERETTAFVLPGWSLVRHENGALVATRKG